MKKMLNELVWLNYVNAKGPALWNRRENKK